MRAARPFGESPHRRGSLWVWCAGLTAFPDRVTNDDSTKGARGERSAVAGVPTDAATPSRCRSAVISLGNRVGDTPRGPRAG